MAAFRGRLVRQRMQESRRLFEETFREIELNSSSTVCWPTSSPCFPKFASGVCSSTLHVELEDQLAVCECNDFEADNDGCGASSHLHTFENHQQELQTSVPVNVDSARRMVHKEVQACVCEELSTECNPEISDIQCDVKKVHISSIIHEKSTSASLDSIILGSKDATGTDFPAIVDGHTLEPLGEMHTVFGLHDSTLGHVDSIDINGHHEVKELSCSGTDDDLAIDLTSLADQDSLISLRRNIEMELVWLEQAIQSRKKYLRFKKTLKT
ncbi:PREDICTED: uncharacterized protein LOC106809606 isoform X4 [Priapulus caudatus]|uniref:Uncharacterized protein LOC106809606 isoform X3 n=1 Tax=Priapulus caudatus TaxID=37621 RepID=A0ABM1E7S9_PRICU|nr:PREDICTED: uncharacterized protein LOC106809606 isoform X3 [Priapulus caudatus]XP_014668260.1 PREDICTED: uncharacterized protein LOC106809606 isoform X4 [Priapulus caudatus]